MAASTGHGNGLYASEGRAQKILVKNMVPGGSAAVQALFLTPERVEEAKRKILSTALVSTVR
ncbi:hypothetical protein F4W66_14455 [Escherichia coli]|nr:hypothetical protein F4W66_14455 [Escherichia coli]